MKIFRLVHDTARQLAQEAVKSAPHGYIVRVSEPTRSLEQNALIHAELTEIGKALGWNWAGQEVDIDDIKSIFVSAYRKATGQDTRFVMGIDNQPVILNWRTRDFSKKECAEFVDFVRAWKHHSLDK